MNTNQLLMKLNDVENENDLLKREIQRLLVKNETDRLIGQNVESCLKQLLIQFECQIDNLTHSFDNSFTCYNTISSMIDILWKIFQYETCTSEIKDINHRLREKLNRKLYNSTIVSSQNDDDYINNDDNNNNESFNYKLINDKSCLLELNYLMQQVTTMKEKLISQNKIIKSLCEQTNYFKQANSYTPNKSTSDMSVSFLVSSLSMHDTHHHHHHPTEFRSASTTTTSQDEEFNDSSLNQNNKNDLFNRKISSTTTTSLHHRQHYICPKCEIQIDKNQVTFEKFEQHIIKCDSSKLVCIFCLEVFDLKQEVDFNNHIQRHLKYVDIRHNISDDYTNDITPTTTSNNMNISRRDSNNSGGGSCSTSSSSNLVSSSSLSSRSNSNNEISNTAEPSNITHQQHRQNSKTCLIIHNFEPKIRKRL